MKVIIDITREELRTLTTLVRTLKEQMGVENRPRKLTEKQKAEYIAQRIIEGNPLTKKEMQTLNK